jgi:L-threonylcarbamoyladenylate synthase
MKEGTDVAFAASLLKQGKLVAIPTETVYGLAGNGLDPHAVAAIFAAKKRPFFDPLILHLPGLEHLSRYVKNTPEYLPALMAAFSPGPVTYVLERTDLVPDLVTSGLPTVGIRFPAHPLTRELLQQLDFPLAAPSANRFGYISPTRPEHVRKQFTDEVSYILDGGACALGIESTILDCTGAKVRILRKGSLAVEDIVEVLGYKPGLAAVSSSKPSAPGNIEVHYAPKTPLYVGDLATLLQTDGHATGIIAFGHNAEGLHAQRIINVSPIGNLREAAVHFFAALHQLDEDESIKRIYCAPFPEEGLGLALNDRLKRAGVREEM